MLQGIRLWHVAPRILERAPSRKRRTMGGAIDREMCRRIAEAYEAGLLQLAPADRGGLNQADVPLINPKFLFRQTQPALKPTLSLSDPSWGWCFALLMRCYGFRGK